MTFEDYSRRLQAEGFDPVVERIWQPGTVVEVHSHPFHARAVIVQGDMWLGIDGELRHLWPGDTFDLPPGLLHTERYGPTGATYWVARRNP